MLFNMFESWLWPGDTGSRRHHWCSHKSSIRNGTSHPRECTHCVPLIVEFQSSQAGEFWWEQSQNRAICLSYLHHSLHHSLHWGSRCNHQLNLNPVWGFSSCDNCTSHQTWGLVWVWPQFMRFMNWTVETLVLNIWESSTSSIAFSHCFWLHYSICMAFYIFHVFQCTLAWLWSGKHLLYKY